MRHTIGKKCSECKTIPEDDLFDWGEYAGYGKPFRFRLVCEPCYLLLEEAHHERQQLAAVWGD